MTDTKVVEEKKTYKPKRFHEEKHRVISGQRALKIAKRARLTRVSNDGKKWIARFVDQRTRYYARRAAVYITDLSLDPETNGAVEGRKTVHVDFFQKMCPGIDGSTTFYMDKIKQRS